MEGHLPCPSCSAVGRVGATIEGVFAAPQWNLARNSSASRGRSVYLWAGCAHALEVGAKGLIEKEDCARSSEVWNAEAQRLFVAKVARWTDAQRESLRVLLGFPVMVYPPREPDPVPELPTPAPTPTPPVVVIDEDEPFAPLTPK